MTQAHNTRSDAAWTAIITPLQMHQRCDASLVCNITLVKGNKPCEEAYLKKTVHRVLYCSRTALTGTAEELLLQQSLLADLSGLVQASVMNTQLFTHFDVTNCIDILHYPCSSSPKLQARARHIGQPSRNAYLNKIETSKQTASSRESHTCVMCTGHYPQDLEKHKMQLQLCASCNLLIQHCSAIGIANSGCCRQSRRCLFVLMC